MYPISLYGLYMLADAVLKLCPDWDLLDEIYGTKVSISPPSLHQTDDNVVSEPEYELENVEVIIHDEELETSNPVPSTPAIEFSKEEVAKARKQLTTPKSYGKGIQKDAVSALTEAQNKRAEAILLKTQVESDRLQAEREWKREQLEFEKEKQLTFDIHRASELKLKEMEIEKNEKLRILELEKDERIAKYKIELEMKLQLDLAKLKYT